MNPRIRKAIAYMAEDLSQPLRLAEVANHAGYTAQHFCVAFKAETGATPARYYKLLRLEKARQMLKSELELALCVKEIAAQTGFRDVSHFVRDFAKHFGLSPKRYREHYFDEKNDFAPPL